MKELLVIMMDNVEFDNLINKEFFDNKKVFEFKNSEEVCSDTIRLFYNVSGNLTNWEENDLKEFLKGNIDFSSYTALQELCKRGIIKPGNYLIEVPL